MTISTDIQIHYLWDDGFSIVSQTIDGLLDSGVAVGDGGELELDSVTYQGKEIDPSTVILVWEGEGNYHTEIDLISYMESGDPIDPSTDDIMNFCYTKIS